MIREGEGRGKAGYSEGSAESLHLSGSGTPCPKGRHPVCWGCWGQPVVEVAAKRREPGQEPRGERGKGARGAGTRRLPPGSVLKELLPKCENRFLRVKNSRKDLCRPRGAAGRGELCFSCISLQKLFTR